MFVVIMHTHTHTQVISARIRGFESGIEGVGQTRERVQLAKTWVSKLVVVVNKMDYQLLIGQDRGTYVASF